MFACDRGCVWAHLFELMPKCLGLRLLSLDALLPLALLVAVFSVFAHRYSVLEVAMGSGTRWVTSLALTQVHQASAKGSRDESVAGARACWPRVVAGAVGKGLTITVVRLDSTKAGAVEL